MKKRHQHQCSHGPWQSVDVRTEWAVGRGWKCKRCGAVQVGGFPDAVEAMLAGAPYDKARTP